MSRFWGKDKSSVYVQSLRLALMICLLSAGISPCRAKSIEMLDERTGVTLAALSHPLAFVETGIYDLLGPDKQPSVIYLGPVERDRSGAYSYALWVQLAPGVGGHRFDDIRAEGAIVLELDGQPVTLAALDAPVIETSPYQPIAPVGQTAYFAVDGALLRRMADSRHFTLKIRAGDLTVVDFIPRHNTANALNQFVVDRGLTGN
jgi:hypothetical protein